MKTRDDFDLTQLRRIFAEASDAEQYEVLSAWAWATRHARAQGLGQGEGRKPGP